MTPFARRLAGLVGLVLVGCLVWWSQSGDPSGGRTAEGPAATATAQSQANSSAPGMPSLDDFTVAIGDLPPEAVDVIGQIEAGGPFAYPKDGGVFGNREKLLPLRERGYYREYTVATPGSADRGARRIIAGGNGELYYTADHYQSFRLIQATT
ncbi:MAG: ribonuclease N1 [Propionibacteriales bacterium]|nr:ribonuclease N1 [Propionibacteriales bacterium]